MEHIIYYRIARNFQKTLISKISSYFKINYSNFNGTSYGFQKPAQLSKIKVSNYKFEHFFQNFYLLKTSGYTVLSYGPFKIEQ